ncbi:MAG: type III-B CRISPR module RAMP protein Cmr1 [Gammaproteobacteria bacterium]|nr:type III-B CRISPR module RAMP protein Cmr1 [Gammaproteobacteria bacterium]
MAKLVTLQATYRIVTPMFLGGAEPDKSVELRPPSIKAALRFWWRALQWARIRLSLPNDNQALAELHKQEGVLFGSAGGGQSQLLLKIRRPVNTVTVNKGSILEDVVNRSGARYLGYGVMEAYDGKNTKAGRLTRPALCPPLEIVVEILCRGIVCECTLDALKLFGLLGGLGSKARKGYGSLTLTHLHGGEIEWRAPPNPGDYIKEIKALLLRTRTLTDEPPFSAFSRRSRVCPLLEGDDPMTILDEYGQQMQRYRSWGNDGKVNGKQSEENFDDDHAWYYGTHPHTNFHPRRVIFGLPHNYFGKRGGREVAPEKLDRRASPLWFHVHDYGQGNSPRYAGIASILRSQFLPDGGQINAGGGKPVPAKVDYGVIDAFLDGCVGHRAAKTSEKYFPHAKQVFP